LLSTFGNANGGVVWSAAWSPDGSKIVTGTSKGDVILWNVSAVSGVGELPRAFAGAEIFPNPTADFVQLTLPADLRLAALELCDATGKTLRRLDPTERQILVADLSKGIYFLKMTAANGALAVFKISKI
jgi:WD40 repeat protein